MVCSHINQLPVGEIKNIPYLFYDTYKNDNYNYRQYLYLLVIFKTVGLKFPSTEC
jgi:hypothetical protein